LLRGIDARLLALRRLLTNRKNLMVVAVGLGGSFAA